MTSDNTKKKGRAEELPAKPKKPWQPMKLKYTGEAKDLIQHGVAKTSTVVGDPGDALKVPMA
jgi:hypothetical protein